MELDGANATPLLSPGKQHASTASLGSATEQRSNLHGGLLCTGVWVRRKRPRVRVRIRAAGSRDVVCEIGA